MTNSLSSDHADGQATVAPSLASAVGKVLHAYKHVLGPGDLADLRRMDPQDCVSVAFWKILGGLLGDEGTWLLGGKERDIAEQRWASILKGMAHSHSFHQPGRRLGTALVTAGFSELRLVRLLRARGDRLLEAIPSVSRYLATKAEPFDWLDLARLLASDDAPWREKTRRGIARHYFTHTPK